MIDIKKLAKAGVHFGHRASIWNPLMKQYIWGRKNDVHLIDVSKTAYKLEKAAKFLESVALEGKSILWVGTKRSAQDIIRAIADRLGSPYVNHRWIGGTLSNYSQVKKSVTKLLHYEDVLSKDNSDAFYTKKELNHYRKIVERLKKNIGGINGLRWPLGAIVLIDINKEAAALREATLMGIPVVGLVDTNADPSLVNFVIPGNDDSPRAIKLIAEYLEEAAARGKEEGKQKKPVIEEVVEETIVEMIAEEESDEKKSARAKKKPEVAPARSKRPAKKTSEKK